MIKNSIILTLNYFSLFEFPLTKEELFSLLWKPEKNNSYESFLNELKLLKEEKKVEEKFGYYFLFGNENFVEKRREAVPFIENKLKKARFAAKIISSVPFLKAIFVCNSLAMEVVDDKSDIDFFIITKKRRAWMVRLFSNMILFAFGMRRNGNKIADRICLSFYVDEDNLNLKRLAIDEEDIYLAYWIKQLLPIYDQENIYDKILQANDWQRKLLQGNVKLGATVTNGKLGGFWKKAWEIFWRGKYGDLIEEQTKKIQMEKIKISSKGKNRAVSTAVVVENGVLKFHEKDARLDLKQKWLSIDQKTI